MLTEKMQMLPINSELRRYYWQDFSLQRIIAMPAVLLAIVYLMLLSYSNFSAIANTAITAFLILVFFWGGHKAACSVIDEVKDNTWDNQRLSSVSPLKLSLGKLFGSTLYTWYGGAIALVIYVGFSISDKPIFLINYDIVLLIASGIFCHSVALLFSVQALRVQNRYSRLHSIAYLILGLMASSVFYKIGYFISVQFQKDQVFGVIKWFGIDFSNYNFLLISLLIFLLWSIIGIYRSMREELKFKNIPWVWGLFVIFVVVYVSGLFHDAHPPKFDSNLNNMHRRENALANGSYIGFLEQFRLGTAFAFAAISTYLMFFADIISITRYRIMWYQWKQRNWIKIGESLPRWMVSFVLTVIVGIMFVVTSIGSGKAYNAFIFIFSIILFMLRDAAILHYFKFSPNNKRAALATMFYLAILYILLPAIFLAAKYKNSIYVFYPLVKDDASITMLLPVLVQLFLVGFLLRYRWKKINTAI
jgi:hypothetical protein